MGIRFRPQNRIAIDPELVLIAIGIAFDFSKSGSGCKIKIAERLCGQKRSSIFPEKPGSDFTFHLSLRFRNRSSNTIRFADRNR
jgi:hypothetical protein